MLDILYVEDNMDDADIFSRLISRMDRPPTFSILSSGSDAIDFLLQQGVYQGQSTPLPRLVLVDLKLPVHSGFDVIQQVRACNRTRYLPLVVYSTSDNPKDMRRAYELGANAYLIKPESHQHIREMLRRAIDFWLTQNQYVP